MGLNYCWPGRLHVITRERCYVTLWLWGYRLHWGDRSPIQSQDGWHLP